MGFKDVRALLIECLEQGRWSAEVRRDIDVKNELATGEMQPEKAINLLQRCRGDQYGSSPYHANRKIACHEFKPVDVDGQRWYIKAYFVSIDAVFISVHKSGS
jgi:hypothetical protein